MQHENEPLLPLPAVRCLSKAQAAEYLGIGLTLLAELQVPCIKLGRRTVYDKVDLDTWLDEYKHCERRRVGKDVIWTNPEMASTKGQIQDFGGSTPRYQTEREYAKVLGLKTKPKP